MREIVLDTETTGLSARGDDRIIEIGCVELLNFIPSGETWHYYINPNREVPQEAVNVHGLTTAFLKDKPLFHQIADSFLDFIGDDQLIIHNASFDIGFLNAELERAKRSLLKMNRVTDTLALARRKHPAGPNSLDALCKRYGIDNSARTLHGALLDSEILADVYLELIGQRQAKLEFTTINIDSGLKAKQNRSNFKRATKLTDRLNAEELKAHQAFIESLGGDVIWKKYL